MTGEKYLKREKCGYTDFLDSRAGGNDGKDEETTLQFVRGIGCGRNVGGIYINMNKIKEAVLQTPYRLLLQREV